MPINRTWLETRETLICVGSSGQLVVIETLPPFQVWLRDQHSIKVHCEYLCGSYPRNHQLLAALNGVVAFG